MDHLQRIAVVGSSCAGKTTLAAELASRLEVSHTELDGLYWGPGWTPLDEPEFRSRVRALTHRPRWVIDGNYSRVRDLIWERATAVVWLDYPFPLVFGRAVTRTLRRILTREEICGGNRERLRDIVDPEWIPWWVVRTFRRRRAELSDWLARPEYAHIRVSRLMDPADAAELLDACAGDGAAPLPRVASGVRVAARPGGGPS